MALQDWQNSVALVTGASSGIGQAIARKLAVQGIRVAALARRQERLEDLRREVEEQAEPGDGTGAVLPVVADLQDEAQIATAFQTIRDKWGGVDIMVNNAGLGFDSPLTSGNTEHWRTMLEVNVLALAICTREAIKDMRKRQVAGHVFHISSMAGHRVPPGSGMYSATKYAVRALTEGLRKELREQESPIRVTAISPGFVETEFAEHYSGSKEKARETYSRFKVLESNDVADALIYALSAPQHVQIHDILMRPTDQPR